MFSLCSDPLFHQPSLEEGIPHWIAPPKVSSIFFSCIEFLWEFFLVFLESLGWLRGSSMGVCEALCDMLACKKGNTNIFWWSFPVFRWEQATELLKGLLREQHIRHTHAHTHTNQNFIPIISITGTDYFCFWLDRTSAHVFRSKYHLNLVYMKPFFLNKILKEQKQVSKYGFGLRFPLL